MSKSVCGIRSERMNDSPEIPAPILTKITYADGTCLYRVDSHRDHIMLYRNTRTEEELKASIKELERDGCVNNHILWTMFAISVLLIACFS